MITQIAPNAYTSLCWLMILLMRYFTYSRILVAEKLHSGLALISFYILNSICRKGASMASETNEKMMDRRLKVT